MERSRRRTLFEKLDHSRPLGETFLCDRVRREEYYLRSSIRTSSRWPKPSWLSRNRTFCGTNL